MSFFILHNRISLEDVWKYAIDFSFFFLNWDIDDFWEKFLQIQNSIPLKLILYYMGEIQRRNCQFARVSFSERERFSNSHGQNIIKIVLNVCCKHKTAWINQSIFNVKQKKKTFHGNKVKESLGKKTLFSGF